MNPDDIPWAPPFDGGDGFPDPPPAEPEPLPN